MCNWRKLLPSANKTQKSTLSAATGLSRHLFLSVGAIWRINNAFSRTKILPTTLRQYAQSQPQSKCAINTLCNLCLHLALGLISHPFFIYFFLFHKQQKGPNYNNLPGYRKLKRMAQSLGFVQCFVSAEWLSADYMRHNSTCRPFDLIKISYAKCMTSLLQPHYVEVWCFIWRYKLEASTHHRQPWPYHKKQSDYLRSSILALK